MEQAICLDSDVLVHFLRNNQEVQQQIMKLEEHSDLCTTDINISELYYGAIMRSSKEVIRLERLLGRLHILPLTSNSARMTGSIRAGLANKCWTLDFRDIMIAAIAIENNCKVFTLKKSHFERIPDLELI